MSRKQHESGKLPRLALVNQLIEHHVEALEGYRGIALKGEDGAQEAIHKARVTTRRLQAVAEFLQFGPRSDHVRGARRRLRKFRASLSSLRNYDVFLDILDRAREKASPGNMSRLDLLTDQLRICRDKAAGKSRRRLKEFDAEGLKNELQCRIEVESAEAEIAQKIREKMFRGLRSRSQQFLALSARLQSASDVETLHELRICAKRLRYLLESLGSLGYREPKAALRWLRGVQTRIGQWHDLAALEQEVIAIVRKKGFLAGNLPQGSQLLEAGWDIVKQKDLKAARAFPVTPSRFFLASVERAVREVGQGLEESP